MKDKLIDDELLGKISPMLKHACLKRPVMKIAGLDKANRVYDHAKHLAGPAATDNMLDYLGITRRTHNAEALLALDGQPFIIVSNHPYGHIDGMMMIGEVGRLRPDFKVMVNWMLRQIDILEDYFIGVNPFTGGEFSNSSVGGVKACLTHLGEGHPLGLFPAGSVSKNAGHGEARDRPWLPTVVKMIQRAGVTVLPAYISGQNSPFFNFLDHFPWWVRNIRLCHELETHRGQTIHLVFGDPIAPDTLQRYDVPTLADYLQERTYALRGRR
ncbi:MAG: lysophospholipid acyltransferase family protein [Mediterranea sp.]|jgi:putative hemolysin|nr:lysophospholipid acyltransferase family protein [Mediterranea sp.]